MVDLLPACRGVSRRDVTIAAKTKEQVRARLLANGPPSVVVHAAGAVGEKDPERLQESLLESTATLIELLAESAPQAKMILIGSAAEIAAEKSGGGSPASYGAIKLAQSRLARSMASAYQVPLMVLRLYNTLGPGQSPALVAAAMIERLHASIVDGEPRLVVRNPEAVRDYLDVRDVARCVVGVGTSDLSGWNRDVVDLCSGQGRSVAALAGELVAAAKVEVSVRIELEERGSVDSVVGNPQKLYDLIPHAPIQTISTVRSLRDMWTTKMGSSMMSKGDYR